MVAAVLLAVLVGIWGLRLSGYLARRNLGHGEDYRYRAMRAAWGDGFAWKSLVRVFLLQGALMWVVSLPVQLAASAEQPVDLGPLAVLGLVVWLVGLGFEAIGDAQLARFKRRPDSQGQVMDQGLWRYTRHPNYFGDATAWWGIFLVATDTGLPGWLTILSPLLMTWFLAKGTGKPLLEKDMAERRPGYVDYVQRTSGFVPLPPKKR